MTGLKKDLGNKPCEERLKKDKKKLMSGER